jgi:general secretion pathway protein H
VCRVDAFSCSRPAPGFTLLEILLVLVVMVIGASLTLPALVRPSGTELRTATGSVVAGLRRARDAAVNRQRATVLTVDTQARRFAVSGEPREHQLPSRVQVQLFTARSELEGEGRGRIRFFPDGSSTGGRVTLASGEQRYHVDVDWFTGQVRTHAGTSGDPPPVQAGQVPAGS